MPIRAEVNHASSGEQEQVRITTLSELLEDDEVFDSDGQLREDADCIVLLIPDTGKAAFNGSHEIKSGKSAGKMSKATFVVAELGSSFAGQPIEYRQTQGDVEGLPLSVKLSITATPPNRDGVTVDEALNRTVEKSPGAVIEAAKSNGSAQVLSA
jgi:hypothetical protein